MAQQRQFRLRAAVSVARLISKNLSLISTARDRLVEGYIVSLALNGFWTQAGRIGDRLRGRRLRRRNMRGRLEPRQQWLLRSHKRMPSLRG